jgi:hypothetical protein
MNNTIQPGPFLKTNTGEYHWAIHYRAGDRREGAKGVYMLDGERVIADVNSFGRGRYRQTRVHLKNVDGAPKGFNSMTMTEFNRSCGKPIGSLRDIVFGVQP